MGGGKNHLPLCHCVLVHQKAHCLILCLRDLSRSKSPENPPLRVALPCRQTGALRACRSTIHMRTSRAQQREQVARRSLQNIGNSNGDLNESTGCFSWSARETKQQLCFASLTPPVATATLLASRWPLSSPGRLSPRISLVSSTWPSTSALRPRRSRFTPLSLQRRGLSVTYDIKRPHVTLHGVDALFLLPTPSSLYHTPSRFQNRICFNNHSPSFIMPADSGRSRPQKSLLALHQVVFSTFSSKSVVVVKGPAV